MQTWQSNQTKRSAKSPRWDGEHQREYISWLSRRYSFSEFDLKALNVFASKASDPQEFMKDIQPFLITSKKDADIIDLQREKSQNKVTSNVTIGFNDKEHKQNRSPRDVEFLARDISGDRTK